jgi:hypothetical protein
LFLKAFLRRARRGKHILPWTRKSRAHQNYLSLCSFFRFSLSFYLFVFLSFLTSINIFFRGPWRSRRFAAETSK